MNWKNILRVCIETCSEKEALGQKGDCSICDDSEDKTEAMARGRLAPLDPNDCRRCRPRINRSFDQRIEGFFKGKEVLIRRV